MRNRPTPVIGALLLGLFLSGCASVGDGGEAADPGADGPASSAGPTDDTDDAGGADSAEGTHRTDAVARERAQAWLEAATLPAGAVPAAPDVATFSSDQGWPCEPVEEIEAFWVIPGATVSETANWLQENPTADLVSTAVAPVPDEPPVDSAIVGYVPVPDAQEGIVYTVQTTADGVAVRAEIAALAADADCPALPDGALRGAPGQG
jgi:hypothetical protein